MIQIFFNLLISLEFSTNLFSYFVIIVFHSIHGNTDVEAIVSWGPEITCLRRQRHYIKVGFETVHKIQLLIHQIQILGTFDFHDFHCVIIVGVDFAKTSFSDFGFFVLLNIEFLFFGVFTDVIVVFFPGNLYFYSMVLWVYYK